MQRVLLASLILLLLLFMALTGQPEKQSTRSAEAKKLRVAVVGAHPDDPESGCGGLIARLTQAEHEVFVGYLTCYRGDRKIGTEPEAKVRKREAIAACQTLGARPHFFDYSHEKLYADEATLEAIAAWLKTVRPDIVVTHWPLDRHPNHHVTSSLVWQCYLREGNWVVIGIGKGNTIGFKRETPAGLC